MNCPCTGSGALNAAGSTLFGWMYSLQGSPDPFSQDDAACQTAIAELKAQGLDPCDPVNADALEAAYETALAENVAVAQSTPASNPLQLGADVLLGTATPSTQIAGQPPAPKSTNSLLLIGFVAITGIGFFLLLVKKAA